MTDVPVFREALNAAVVRLANYGKGRTPSLWTASPAELERWSRECHDHGDEQPANALREEVSAARQRDLARRKWRER